MRQERLMRYRRLRVAGGTLFFTVIFADRQSRLLTTHIDTLRDVLRLIRQRHPFQIIATVVLPVYLHAIWRLPESDSGYPMRSALIKATFSRRLPKVEAARTSRLLKRERGIW